MLYNAALAAAYSHDKEQSFRFVQKALSMCPSDQRACLLMTRILSSNTQFDEALSLIEKKYDRIFLLESMKILLNKGDYQGAESFARKLRSNWPTDPTILFYCFKLYLAIGKITTLMEILQAWTEIDNGSSNYYYCLSQICLLCKDSIKAEQYMKNATELDQTNGEKQAALSEILFKNGNKESALDKAKYAIEIDPNCIYGWIMYEKLSSGEEAKKALQKVIQLRKIMVDLSGLDFILSPHQMRKN